MLFIPGFIVSILTFPGVILHEWSHKFFCDRLGVPVYEVKYFTLGNPAGYVRHGEVTRYRDVFLITVAPFIINSTSALLMFLASAFKVHGYIGYFILWLGFSFAMHAFPSDADAKHLWNMSRNTWRQAPVALIGFPVVAVIFIANILKFFWFDLLYAFTILGIALGIVGISSFAASMVFPGQPAAGSLSDYTYMKEHEVWSRTGGNLTDYQMMFVIHKSAGKDDWDDVYLNGHSCSWPNDIRFSDGDNNPLSYWVESYTDETANVWVRFNTISTGTTVKLYYGKYLDRGASDGMRTFQFFDDFDSLNASRWQVTGNPTVNDGVVTILSGGDEQGIHSVQGFGDGYAVRARIRSGHFNDDNYGEWFGLLDMTDRRSGILATYCKNTSTVNGKYNMVINGRPTYMGIKGWKAGEYMVQEFSRKDSQVDSSVNDLNNIGFSVGNLPGDTNIVASTELSNSRLDVDWILIHKTNIYVPANGEWSSEKWLIV